ncbi:MAG TPA: hypothetical protein VN703_01035 [Candidatus Sulfopaludibacter sp.]|nr:hypothetical protein [Candidatus Sulfopaludibacter sp.]
MLIRLEQSFIETLLQLNENFTEAGKSALAASIESKYDIILTFIKDHENKNVNLEPKVIELGNIGSRCFSLTLYHSMDSENDDIPLSITQLLPTISPIRIDIMAKLQSRQQSNDADSGYLKAGQVYDDGDIHSKYVNEMVEEDEGRRPMT